MNDNSKKMLKHENKNLLPSMKAIKKVSIIGLGALGILYGQHILNKIPNNDLRIIADSDRVSKYKKEGIYCNGEICDFTYLTPDQEVEPADLLIMSVKYTHLSQALDAIKNHVGPETIIISVLNGIQSEIDIAKRYGQQHLLYCVAQGMTASKVGNEMSYKNKGILCFGELEQDINSEKVTLVKSFFDQIELPYEVNNKMALKLWSKLMANVGINQTVAYYNTTNGRIQQSGEARDMMIGAMREVIVIAQLEGVNLQESDLEYWLDIIAGLNSEGMPSMAQDVKAKRFSEIELFAGTIVKLAQKHQVEVPVNNNFYKYFTQLEATYK